MFCLMVFFALFYPSLYFVLLWDKHSRAWFVLLVFDLEKECKNCAPLPPLKLSKFTLCLVIP